MEHPHEPGGETDYRKVRGAEEDRDGGEGGGPGLEPPGQRLGAVGRVAVTCAQHYCTDGQQWKRAGKILQPSVN